MSKICCVCKCIIENENDYDRIGEDFYCSFCSDNNLVPCPICKTIINPDVDTNFQAPDGTLFCSQACMDVVMTSCTECSMSFYNTGKSNICSQCMVFLGKDL